MIYDECVGKWEQEGSFDAGYGLEEVEKRIEEGRREKSRIQEF